MNTSFPSSKRNEFMEPPKVCSLYCCLNHLQLETTEMSINKRMDKLIVVYSHLIFYNSENMWQKHSHMRMNILLLCLKAWMNLTNIVWRPKSWSWQSSRYGIPYMSNVTIGRGHPFSQMCTETVVTSGLGSDQEGLIMLCFLIWY